MLDLLFHHFNPPHPFAAFALSAIATTFWYRGTKPGIVAVLAVYLIYRDITERKKAEIKAAMCCAKRDLTKIDEVQNRLKHRSEK
jgi:hypothetical protein